MENAADALYIASAALLFLIALSVAMFSTGKLRQATDAIFDRKETMEMSKDAKGYINFMESSNSTRIVDSATVVSSMMRSIKENYVVYIKLNDTSGIDEGENKEQIKFSKADHDLVIDGIPEPLIHTGDRLIEITVGEKKYGVNQEAELILKNGFYDIIKNKSFYEYLGVYQNNSEASSENKVTYRIITYVEK